MYAVVDVLVEKDAREPVKPVMRSVRYGLQCCIIHVTKYSELSHRVHFVALNVRNEVPCSEESSSARR